MIGRGTFDLHTGVVEPDTATFSDLMWLTLKNATGIGPRTIRQLIAKFGSMPEMVRADRSELNKFPGGLRVWHALRDKAAIANARHVIRQAAGGGYSICTPDSPTFPAVLKSASHVPPALFVQGRLMRESRSVAIVGSRRPTEEGRHIARTWARDFAIAGISVISGLALGIDGCAHSGALEAGGHTVGVLGSGPDKFYPEENRLLGLDMVARRSAVISEFWPGTEPAPYLFPTRNRTIAGLAEAVIVVEAAGRSGALYTAEFAQDDDRPVFAVPGPLSRATSKGTNTLIGKGATLAASSEQVIEALVGDVRQRPKRCVDGLSPAQQRIWEHLDGTGVHLDHLAQSLDARADTLLVELLQMELMGMVCQLPGKRFQARMN